MFNEIKKGVFYTDQKSPSVGKDAIYFLYEYCKKNNINLARLCLHESVEMELMSMLIVITNFFIYPIHKHSWKDESYTILCGEGIYEEYDMAGTKILEKKLITGDSLFNNSRRFHMIRPITKKLAFIETTIGPFTDRVIDYLEKN